MDSRESPIRLHFNDTVQTNIHSHSQPLWDDPPPVPFWNNMAIDSRRNMSPESQRRDETEEFHQIFLRARPKLRGIFQIFMAHFQLALGIALIYIGGRNYTYMSYITFWGPTIFVISGCMALRARGKPSYKLVKACFVLHTISCSVAFTGLTLCCIDDFQIFLCSAPCSFGSVGTLSIISFLLMTNIVQLLSSGCILICSYHALKCISRNPPETTPVQNLGVMSLDPPAYSEVSTSLSQMPTLSQPVVFLQPSTYPSESTEPPAYRDPPGYLQTPVFSPTADDPPPPYSE